MTADEDVEEDHMMKAISASLAKSSDSMSVLHMNVIRDKYSLVMDPTLSHK